MKKLKNIVSVILLLLSFVLIFILVFTRIQGKTPQLFGYRLLRISSASMSPTLNVGDIILSKSVDDIANIEAGDIITYNGEVGSYRDKLITHRVIQISYDDNGQFYLQTMGIANDYADPWISEKQIVGKMVCTVPLLSRLYSFFLTPWGLGLVLGFLALLFINEAVTLKKIIKNDAKECELQSEA